MAGLRVHFVFPAVLVERVDAVRGGVSRGEFVRRAVEQALSGTPGGQPVPESRPPPAPAEQPECPDPGVVKEGRSSAGHREFPASAPLPASYRQSVPGPNVEGVRSSFQAKRDVLPVPKGKS